jgi:hypothetical protein
MKRLEALLLGALEALHHGIMHASTLVDIRSKLTSKVKAAQLQVGEGKSSPISFFFLFERKKSSPTSRAQRKGNPLLTVNAKGSIDRISTQGRQAAGACSAHRMVTMATDDKEISHAYACTHGPGPGPPGWWGGRRAGDGEPLVR